jgi:endonuclease IV
MGEERTEEMAVEEAGTELGLDDLDQVAGGSDPRGRIEICVDCGATFYANEGHDCPDQ